MARKELKKGFMIMRFTLFILDTGKTDTLTTSEDQDQMLHKAAFYQCL